MLVIAHAPSYWTAPISTEKIVLQAQKYSHKIVTFTSCDKISKSFYYSLLALLSSQTGIKNGRKYFVDKNGSPILGFDLKSTILLEDLAKHGISISKNIQWFPKTCDSIFAHHFFSIPKTYVEDVGLNFSFQDENGLLIKMTSHFKTPLLLAIIHPSQICVIKEFNQIISYYSKTPLSALILVLGNSETPLPQTSRIQLHKITTHQKIVRRLESKLQTIITEDRLIELDLKICKYLINANGVPTMMFDHQTRIGCKHIERGRSLFP